MAVTIATRNAVGKRIIWTAGAADGAAQNVIDTSVLGGDMSRWDYFNLMTTGGTAVVHTSQDGVVWSAPLSLADLGSISTAPVLATIATHMMGFQGCYKFIRVQSVGALTDLQMTASSLTE